MKIYVTAADKLVFSRGSLKETASGGADVVDCELLRHGKHTDTLDVTAALFPCPLDRADRPDGRAAAGPLYLTSPVTL